MQICTPEFCLRKRGRNRAGYYITFRKELPMCDCKISFSLLLDAVVRFAVYLFSNPLLLVCFPGTHLPNGDVSGSLKSKFDDKVEPSSAKMYFHYYGQLLHQQNMLQDYVRTGYVMDLYKIFPLSCFSQLNLDLF